MKRTNHDGGFFVCLLLNLLLNFSWTIPAWILLLLHFWKGWSLWFFVGGLVLWLGLGLLVTSLMNWASRCSTPTEQRENKNPYSIGNERKDEDGF